jgi:DNA mismatch endonuclease (patch repair protein)
VQPKYRTVIFVNGCFWHQHKGCKEASRPKTRRKFWADKLDGNVRRDQRNYRALRRLGWKVIVVWECELEKRPERVLAKLKRLFVI